jgi:hypothetical protein
MSLVYPGTRQWTTGYVGVAGQLHQNYGENGQAPTRSQQKRLSYPKRASPLAFDSFSLCTICYSFVLLDHQVGQQQTFPLPCT